MAITKVRDRLCPNCGIPMIPHEGATFVYWTCDRCEHEIKERKLTITVPNDDKNHLEVNTLFKR